MTRSTDTGLPRRHLLAATGIALAAPSIVRAQGRTRGVALVIGNSRYSWEAPLPNVRRDAPDIAKRLQELGLKTELVQDAGRAALVSAIETFRAAASGQDLAVVYYAGHGASWSEDTYLVPVDSDLGNPNTVKNLVSVKSIISATQGASHRILIFDNCRNNPAGGWRQRDASESAWVNAASFASASLHGPNSLVLFSTAPGRVALDGPPGQNSPFAAALLRQLAAPSIDVAALPALVRRDLLVATEGQQVLWSESTYAAPFVLSGGRGAAPPALAIDPSRVVDLPNAYAFARDKKLALPAGLVAVRPPGGSPHDAKIGAFESTFKQRIGGHDFRTSVIVEPLIFIVLSVDGANNAQTIFSFREFSTMRPGINWNFWEGKAVSSELKLPVQSPPILPFWMRWHDRNSGSCTTMSHQGSMYQAKFTRLDG